MNNQIKNILIISPYFYPDSGGLENYAYQVARELVKNNYQITVLCLSRNHDSVENIDGMKVIRKRARLIISNTPIGFSFLPAILRIIKSENIQLIHAHTPVPFAVDMAAIASYIKNIPLIVTYHFGSLYKNKFFIDVFVFIYKLIENLALRRASKIVVVSPHIKDQFKKWGSKLEVITPGVDPLKFGFMPYPFSNQNLLFIASLKKSHVFKGLNVLLKALSDVQKKNPAVRLLVAGSGDLLNFYKNLADKLGISNHVEFLGQVDYKNIPSLFKDTNILVVPSVSNEGCPTVLFEAMASARPIVGTNIGGIPFIISEAKCGKIVKPNNPIDLANAVIYLLKNKNIAKEMGERGRKIVENKYTWNKISNQYIKIYDEIFN